MITIVINQTIMLVDLITETQMVIIRTVLVVTINVLIEARSFLEKQKMLVDGTV